MPTYVRRIDDQLVEAIQVTNDNVDEVRVIGGQPDGPRRAGG